ncbi:DUF4186 domain-containing protein [Klebsiella pneumoniae subsp. pneumoniae]|nr:DUF4186 domain-containing protein [Klebsiella pneumoniae subsp. pneumoniae]
MRPGALTPPRFRLGCGKSGNIVSIRTGDHDRHAADFNSPVAGARCCRSMMCKQTPMRGHPVFIAPARATANCCRVAAWKKMAAGTFPTASELERMERRTISCRSSTVAGVTNMNAACLCC